MFTRRNTLAFAAAGVAAAAAGRAALAQGTQPATAGAAGAAAQPIAVPGGGGFAILPVEHASLVVTHGPHRILVDPVGDPARYGAAAHLILVTHEHGDHFEPEALTALAGEDVPLIVNPAVFEKLPEALRARATAMANGDTHQALDGAFSVDAVPAYNITEERLKYHPKGRDNGYVLTSGDSRLYIAGDTEDTPEMMALEGISLALLPMNLPYTQTPEQAANAVKGFAPQVAVPYHHRGTDPEAFARLVADLGNGTEVVIADWYPGSDDPTGGEAPS